MIDTENHHWVSKFLLRNFTSDDGRVYFIDLNSRRIGKRPPKQLASLPNFNQLIVQGEPSSFEEFFGRIETKAAPSIRKLLSEGNLHCLSEEERFTVSKFLAAQSFRTDAYRKGLKAGYQKDDLGTIIATHAADIDPLASMINLRRWVLMRSPESTPFLIGDNPLVLQKTEHPSQGGSLGFDIPGVEAFMPLSPSYALYLPSPDIGDLIIGVYWDALCTVTGSIGGIKPFPKIRSKEYDLAEKCLQSGEAFYRSLRLGDVFEADDENAINLNALQVFWASSQVYSNSKNFSFVEHVLNRSPEAQNIIPVRLANPRLEPI